jgi:hypothetical protein
MQRRRATIILAGLTLLVLALSLPGSLRDAFDRGGIYLFSSVFLEDIRKRLAGPGRFRADWLRDHGEPPAHGHPPGCRVPVDHPWCLASRRGACGGAGADCGVLRIRAHSRIATCQDKQALGLVTRRQRQPGVLLTRHLQKG